MQVRNLPRAAGRRPAFTLIELMVAMALTLFVMVVLTQVYVTSLATFSGLKSIGELQANLRTVSSILQADLAQDHFEGKRRLSSPDLPTMPPRQGFLAIYQAAPSFNEGFESTVGAPPNPAALGMQSYRAANHVLYFTIRLRGDRQENYLSATVPAGSLLPGATFFGQSPDGMFVQPGFYNSQWAEVCYFLVKTGTTDNPASAAAATGTPLYALYRCQYLLVPNPAGMNVAWPPAAAPYPYANVSGSPNNPSFRGFLVFNAPDDVAGTPNAAGVPVNTAGNSVSSIRTLNAAVLPPTRWSDPPGQSPIPSGATLVLSNVTSFQVQVFTNPPQLDANNNPILDFVDLSQVAANFPAVFDTSNPPGYNITAIKVTIRIWDAGSQLSRQVTVIQDM